MARKFIITNTKELRQGDVPYHKNLLPNNEQTKELHAIGGGSWDSFPKEECILYYGFSAKFGKVKQKDMEECEMWRVPVIESGKWRMLFSTEYDLEKAKDNYIEISTVKQQQT